MEHSQERDRVARPTLSWRTDRHTQCGRAADDVSSVISIDDLEARIQRATDRANREDQLPDVLGYQSGRGSMGDQPYRCRRARSCARQHRLTGAEQSARGVRFAGELRVITVLIEAHRGGARGTETPRIHQLRGTAHERCPGPPCCPGLTHSGHRQHHARPRGSKRSTTRLPTPLPHPRCLAFP
jgi:hypothetical protein